MVKDVSLFLKLSEGSMGLDLPLDGAMLDLMEEVVSLLSCLLTRHLLVRFRLKLLLDLPSLRLGVLR